MSAESNDAHARCVGTLTLVAEIRRDQSNAAAAETLLDYVRGMTTVELQEALIAAASTVMQLVEQMTDGHDGEIADWLIEYGRRVATAD